ncbi:hypothetical protein BDV11DRAFT_214583 [Aspergillus similis]
MRSSILAFLPALAAAADFQITSWFCKPLLDPNEGQKYLSVRDAGETGCAGYTLNEHEDGSYAGAFSGNENSNTTFIFTEEPSPVFTANFSDYVRPGTCTPALGYDVCKTLSVACSITILWDCSYDVEAHQTKPQKRQQSVKVMVAGDSISHGMDSDWTWRWRLFAWLQLSYDVNFVGPWVGTHGVMLPEAAMPQPPVLPGESPLQTPDVVGGYADGVPNSFTSTGHASFWGRQVAQTKDTIKGWVAEYQPDYLIILLGFNDLGWFVSGPEDLVGNMGQLVENAREAKPDVKILLGNVVHRKFLKGRQDLVDNTNKYNQLLRDRYPSWFRWESPISYVDVNANYDCHPESCPDGYDGLHPNSMGEYHIAQAFARSLKADFGFHGPDFEVPTNPEPRIISTPTGVQTFSYPEGLYTTWKKVPNARGYDIRSRLQGMTGWWSEGQVYPNTYASWTTWLGDGQTWEFQVRTRGDNDDISSWSELSTAKTDLQTSQGPPNIVVVPSGDGIRISWGPITGYSVNRYGVIIWDKDTEGAFIDTRGVSGTSLFIGGLISGHRYGTWVATYVNMQSSLTGEPYAAGGLPAAGREVIIGSFSPSPPTNLRVTNTDATTVQLSWNPSEGVTGYAIYVRAKDKTAFNVDGTTTGTTYGVAFLFPGTWNFEFCIASYNGNLESPHSSCIIPPVYEAPDSPGPKGNIRLTFSDETINIGTIKIGDITDKLNKVCSTQGQCDTNPFTLNGQLVEPGLGGSVNNLILTVNPSGAYPTWIHNGLIDTLYAAVTTLADCYEVTNTPTCPSPMTYCPSKPFTVTECKVPQYWGINYQDPDESNAAPPFIGADMQIVVDGGGFCQKMLTAMGAVASAVNGAAGGIFTLLSLACKD